MSPENYNETKAPGKFAEMLPFDWELLRHAGAEPVPNHLNKWWFCLGGTVAYLFIIQMITGISLTFYYIPSPQFAYDSVANITHNIRFGWYIRSLHKWSSNFMIVAVFLHMIRVYFTHAYRHPRQLNWMVGFALMAVTLIFGFTGYSLVYEQLSYWGATVAANLAQATPVIGGIIGTFLRGGPEVGANTLTRFYILHIGFLPMLALMLIGMHILLIRLQGVTELQFENESPEKARGHFKFFPDHITTELIVGVLLMYLLTILALIFPTELGDRANPAVTPPHIKPEWYFYFNYRLLKLTSLQVSVVLTMVFGGIAFFWPFIDEFLKRKLKANDTVIVIIGVIAVLTIFTLTVWESFSG
ncbi:cytochrome bc complex cytochrome b subunit [candidate division KSB1 bacterium]|nr:cytochrome bc complex cytochrome b subunit [candidate division KSB1 bacterium]